MEYFIKYLERKIESFDELGGLVREKAVYQSVLKDYRKAINVHCCKSDSDPLPNITLEQAIAKAKPNLDKIIDVDKHIEDIR